MLTSQTLISLLAAGLALGSAPPDPNAGPPSAAGKWSIVTNGTAGVIALEAIIVSPTLALFFDRPANNTFSIDGHAAWGALYNLETNEPTALRLTTNTFCASGAFLSNGTMVSVGGSAAENLEDDDASGLQSVRLFGPCDDPAGAGCTVFEDVNNLHLAAARWYTTSIKIPDGSLMIIGGIAVPTPFYNDQPVNSFEFFPPKDGGVPRPSAFLEKTLPANLFPRAFLLPDGRVFMVANNRSQIYDIETNTEIPLPDIPNGVRVTNPFDGTGTILPLSPPDYVPEVLICGGTNISDATPALNVSSQTPASDQCSRIKLTPEGIKAGWQVERMLEGRMMPETLLLPNGQILITSGAMTGAAAVASVGDPVGNSNADHPALTPSLYTPTARLGQRISNAVMPKMNIPRMYHSSATLTPKGSIMLAGSNPNGLIQPPGTEKFPSEFRVDHLLPPFFNSARPSILSTPKQIRFSEQVTIPVNIPRGLSVSNIQVGLMDLGFSSHAWHSSQRLVFLVSSLSKDGKSLTIRAPPNGKIFPPGPAFIFLTVDNVWSSGSRLMIGSGRAPPTLD